MQLTINNIRILSPSPTTFILDIEQSVSDTAHSRHVTYVGSAEHCYTTSATLLNRKLAHSTTYKMLSADSAITAYAMFDMNDLLIGANADFADVELDVNYIIAPTVVNVADKLNNPINGILHNKNGFYGVIDSSRHLMQMPSRKFTSDAADYYEYTADKDTINLYSKKPRATSIRHVVRLDDEYDIVHETAADNKFEHIFAIQTFNAFQTNTASLNANQSISAWTRLANNFDNGMLSAALLLTPKQTLNTEYSTRKDMLQDSSAYKYMRKYNTNNNDMTMYASGNLLIFNYIEAATLEPVLDVSVTQTQINTSYSANIGLTEASRAINKAISNNPMTTLGMYQDYLPEVVNITDDGLGGDDEPTTTPGSKRALHKSTLFHIDIADSSVAGPKYSKAMSLIPSAIADSLELSDADVTESIRNTLHQDISNRLQSVVAEIIPARTHLYKVKTS